MEEENPRSGREIDIPNSSHNWAKAWEPSSGSFSLLLFNDPTKIINGPVAEQLASDPMLRESGV